MEETSTQRADRILHLIEKVPVTTKEQRELHRSVSSLCQKVKELDPRESQFRPRFSAL